MRAKTYLYLLLLLFFASCESPILNEDEDIAVEENGNLTINTFPSDQTRLNVALYTLEGTRVKQINQKKTDSNFGTVSIRLEPRTYQLLVISHSSNGNPTMTDPHKVQFTNAKGFTDTFIHFQTITISDEPVLLNLTLERITSLCHFVITDEIPAEVAKIQFTYRGGSGAFDAKTGLGCVNSIQKATFPVSPEQKRFELYTYLHDSEGTLKLNAQALDAEDNILKEKDFNVPMSRNRVTILSCDFFSNNSPFNTAILDFTSDWEGIIYLVTE